MCRLANEGERRIKATTDLHIEDERSDKAASALVPRTTTNAASKLACKYLERGAIRDEDFPFADWPTRFSTDCQKWFGVAIVSEERERGGGEEGGLIFRRINSGST